MFQLTCIEGNIGSGKTTLFTKLKEHYKSRSDIIFLEEPVSEWEKIKDAEGNTMLKKFYGDQEKYAFPFQMMAFISRLSLLNKTIKENPNAMIISERSLYTDKLVFAKMLHDKGLIEDVNYQIYNCWFQEFVQDLKITNIIYVKTDPAICFQRINTRARDGENTISQEYLESCHDYHEKMLDKMHLFCDYKKDVVLDGNVNIYENPETLNAWIKNIDEMVSKPRPRPKKNQSIKQAIAVDKQHSSLFYNRKTYETQNKYQNKNDLSTYADLFIEAFES